MPESWTGELPEELLGLGPLEGEDSVALTIRLLALLDTVLHPEENRRHKLAHHPDHGWREERRGKNDNEHTNMEHQKSVIHCPLCAMKFEAKNIVVLP